MEQSNYSGLPDQIIVDEILIRLPVKSLCRFKAVSKPWNAVISSSKFAKVHLNYNTNKFNPNSKGVFFRYKQQYSFLLDYEAYDREDPVQKRFDHSAGDYVNPGGLRSLGKELNAHLNGLEAEPIGSSCGLVCFLAKEGQFCICNPILRQWGTIISPPRPFGMDDLILCGFGYVSSIDDFKIVLGLKGQPRDQRAMLYVFSLGNSNWRTIEGGDHFDVLTTLYFDWKSVLVNRSLHWWITPTGDSNDGRILAFDLLHEVFNEIPIPEVLSAKVPLMVNSSETSGLSAMEGCLCLSTCWEEDKNGEIWMLKRYEETNSWVKLYDQLRFLSGCCYYYAEFFGFTKTGKFLIRCNFGTSSDRDNHIFLVDPKQSYPKFNIIESFDHNLSTIVNYVESLVSPFDLGTPTRQ